MTPTLSPRARLGAVVLAAVVLAALAVTYTVRATDRPEPTAGTHHVTLDNTHGLYVRSERGTIAALGKKSPQQTGLSCRRFYASGNGAVCLTTKPGIPPRSQAIVLDRSLHPRRSVTFGGTPNRARVSPSGRMVSWTVFVSGDSYAGNSFSTRSGILDTRTGYLIKNVETLRLTLDGKRYGASDLNFWGITFADDDNRFYATASTHGKTYLVEGDLKNWTARTLRTNVECPSLSPDGTRIAFKKRVREGTSDPWQLHVLDLKTMRETPLAEARSVDDQAAWLDDRTVSYALPGQGRNSTDVWSVPADGSGAPKLLARDASSPSMNAPESR